MSSERETRAVPADWRRSAWGLFLALLGASFVVATAPMPLTPASAQLIGGGLLIGLGMGLTDHVVGREHERLTTRIRNWINHDPRA